MRQFEINKVDKDYFTIKISGVNLGKFERSDIRHMIELLDEAIGTEMTDYNIDKAYNDWRDEVLRKTEGSLVRDVFNNN